MKRRPELLYGVPRPRPRTRPTRPQTLYLQNGTREQPSVRISKTSDGIMWSITATGRSLNLARIRAEKTYRDVLRFVREMEKA